MVNPWFSKEQNNITQAQYFLHLFLYLRQDPIINQQHECKSHCQWNFKSVSHHCGHSFVPVFSLQNSKRPHLFGNSNGAIFNCKTYSGSFQKQAQIAKYFGRDHNHDAFSDDYFWHCVNVYTIDQRTRAQYIFIEHRGIKKKNV